MLPRVPRGSRLFILLATLLILACLIVEEVQYASLIIWHKNRYSSEVTRQITVHRNTTISRPIAIVIILQDSSHQPEYALARETVECYAAANAYTLHVVDGGGEWRERCPQADFMFRRHCIVRRIMERLPEEWVLFLDADIGVINPNHLIEEYLPTDDATHVVFYDRIMNHEIMAGSYLIRNSEFGRRWLKYWADAAFNLPASFHGTDNGALHNALLEFAAPQLHAGRAACRRLWQAAKDWLTLAPFTVCSRALMTKAPELAGFELRGKQHSKRWARDGWLTDNVWADDDFMLHGWQNTRKDRNVFARWHSPLVRLPSEAASIPKDQASRGKLAEFCRANPTRLHDLWVYKDSFIRDPLYVHSTIGSTVDKMQAEFFSIAKGLKL